MIDAAAWSPRQGDKSEIRKVMGIKSEKSVEDLINKS